MATITSVSSLYSSDLTNGTYTAPFTRGNYKIYATSEKNVTVPKVATETVNNKEISQALDLRGGGVAGSYRCVEFTTAGAATITVYAKGASGRKLTLATKNSILKQFETTSFVAPYTFTVSAAGTYYIHSASSAIQIFYIKTAVSSTQGSTPSTPTAANGNITMDGNPYSTIQAALDAATSGSHTIKLANGTYKEVLYYKGSATIKISGASKDGTIIAEANSQVLKKLASKTSSTQKARCLFEFEGSGNLILENLSLKNTFQRDGSTNETQAEALGFDSTGVLAAYNVNFISHQDTVRTTGKAWFYKCYVEGDVDFIWMEKTGRVALFEGCTIKSNWDDKGSHEAIIGAPRMDVTSTVSKGLVFLNCSITGASGNKTYLARTPWSSGYYNQAAFINCTTSNIEASVWKGSQIATSYDVTDIGWKLDSATAKNLGVSGKNYIMSDSKKNAEYANRTQIVNRYFDTGSKTYKTESNGWDIESFGASQGWIAGSSSGGSTNPTVTTDFKPADRPIGFASVNASSTFGGYGKNEYTVSNKADFVKYAKAGNCVIYVKGTIDLSDGCLPNTAGGTTSALDSFVKSTSGGKYANYPAWVSAYTKACTTSSNDKISSTSNKSSLNSDLYKLHNAYDSKALVKLGSNLTIIGLGGAVIKGGCIRLDSVSNIAIRNVTIQDAYDPFPHHETNDGYNAEYDGLVLASAKNVWIDHCTLQDTMHCVDVKTNGSTTEKWQTYDGLFDCNGSFANITVSYCKFYNHDKTCLHGASDTESFEGTRTITHCFNYYLDCGQRLPFMRMAQLHSFCNYFDTDGNKYYTSGVCIQPRHKALIIAENNYFGAGEKYAFKGDSKTGSMGSVGETKVYQSGNVFKCTQTKNGEYFTYVGSKPFSVPYSYSLASASTNVASAAGAR